MDDRQHIAHGAGPAGPMSRPCCGGGRHRRGGTGRGALVEPAVLAALLREGGHGYDLRKSISSFSGDDLCVDHGGLYRILRRLEDEGYVRSAWAEGDAGPQRREYELTPAGIELAADWVAHLKERQRLAGMLAQTIEDSLPRGAGDRKENDSE